MRPREARLVEVLCCATRFLRRSTISSLLGRVQRTERPTPNKSLKVTFAFSVRNR